MNFTPARRGAILYPALFLAGFVFIFAATNRFASIYDEGLILTGAMRIGHGEIPHRDFYANYGPAQFYVVALLFKLFGPWAMAERLWDFAIRAAIATLSFAAVRTCCRPAAAFATYIACLIWLGAVSSPGFPLSPALLFSLAAVLLLVSSEGNAARLEPVVAAGGCVGATALFRYDVGGLVGAALMAVLIVAEVRRGNRFWRARPLWLFAAGAVAVFGPVALAYLLTGGPIGAFIHDVFYASTYYPRTRSLPFPSPDQLWNAPIDSIVYLPPVVVAVALALAAARSNAGARRWVIAAFAALCVALYLKGWVRISPIHTSGATIVALILLPVLWTAAKRAPLRRALVLAAAALVAVPTFFALKTTVKTAEGNLAFVADFLRHGAAACDPPQQLGPVACLAIGEARAAAYRYVVGHVGNDERLFAGTARHDKIFVNDNLIYFATQRLPATHWHHYDPGLQTRSDIQADMVAELERQAVRTIVLTSEWDNVMEPNASAQSSGVTILDDYIRTHYDKVEQYGPISVLARKGQP
ncbi:ArnT family glycosyltransferase [Bradyrhizobium sp.]